MTASPPGPTLLGFDVIWIGTVLVGIATLAMLLAIYAALDRKSTRLNSSHTS